MKKTLTAVALALWATCGLAQVRVIDAPYQAQAQAPVANSGTAAGRHVDQVAASTVYQASPVLQAGFEVTPADQNLRRTLVRWSKMVGWSFDAEHWTMGSDIPVSGSASLGNDFKAAVRTLLASSEMTDLPAQPCFYSNNVLRVIPLNELCSRQQAPKAQ